MGTVALRDSQGCDWAHGTRAITQGTVTVKPLERERQVSVLRDSSIRGRESFKTEPGEQQKGPR